MRTRRHGDLDSAVALAREAARHRSVPASDRYIYLATLANALTDRAEEVRSRDDLDAAISLLEEALALVPTDSSHTPRIEFNLGCRYADRHERHTHGEDNADLQAAVDYWDAALARGVPSVSVNAAKRLANVAFAEESWAQAALAAGTAIAAASSLSSVRALVEDKERARSEVQGTGAVAAVAAFRAGQGGQVVVMHLERAAAVLRAEHLGRPVENVSFDDIVGAAEATGGVVLYVAATPAGGIVATVDGRGRVRSVAVPRLQTDRVASELDLVRRAFDSEAPGASDRRNAAAGRLLRYTSDTIAEPAAKILSRDVETLVVVPVGRVGWLPISTARGDADGSLLGLVEAVTVVPNARLATTDAEWRPGHLFIVAHPGPSDRRIAGVWDEARILAGAYEEVRHWRRPPVAPALPPWPGRRGLRRGAPAVEAGGVDAALVDGCGWADVVHVACHLDVDLDHPERSVLLLDEPVLSSTLAGGHGNHIVLSACDSGLTGTRLPDEALGAATALVDSGARSVTAALWPVDDASAPAFMADLHRRMASGIRPSVALAGVQRKLASEPPAEWAAFMNAGAP